MNSDPYDVMHDLPGLRVFSRLKFECWSTLMLCRAASGHTSNQNKGLWNVVDACNRAANALGKFISVGFGTGFCAGSGGSCGVGLEAAIADVSMTASKFFANVLCLFF